MLPAGRAHRRPHAVNKQITSLRCASQPAAGLGNGNRGELRLGRARPAPPLHSSERPPHRHRSKGSRGTRSAPSPKRCPQGLTAAAAVLAEGRQPGARRGPGGALPQRPSAPAGRAAPPGRGRRRRPARRPRPATGGPRRSPRRRRCCPLPPPGRRLGAGPAAARAAAARRRARPCRRPPSSRRGAARGGAGLTAPPRPAPRRGASSGAAGPSSAQGRTRTRARAMP